MPFLRADPTIANPFPGIASASQGYNLTKSPSIQIIILISVQLGVALL